MSDLTSVRASNSLITEADIPKTAVFVGGTDGIGKSALEKLVSEGSSIKVYVVGRDEARHSSQLDELRKINPRAVLIYLQGQISLLAEAQRLANEIASQEDKIDLLFLSAGYLPFTGPQETSEGLEASLAVAYYSRIIFIMSLLPKLRHGGRFLRSPRVVFILAAGKESTEIFLDDIDLQIPGHFSLGNYAGQVATLATLTLKHLAEDPENQDIVFIHAHPGLVSTNLMKKSWGDKFNPGQATGGSELGTFTPFTPGESGERCLFLITSAEYGGKGVAVQSGREAAQTLTHSVDGSLFSVDDKLQALQQDELLTKLEEKEASRKIWDHTMRLLKSTSQIV